MTEIKHYFDSLPDSCVKCGRNYYQVTYEHLRNFCPECSEEEVANTFIKYEVRALTWKEPFGNLMLHGKIETRVWGTKYRGLVLICCGKKSYSFEDAEMIGLKKGLKGKPLPNPGFRTLGMAIAIGKLVDCRPMRKADEEKCFVNYHKDLMCHVYENVRAIKPFEWKGSLRWRKLTNKQKAKIVLINTEEFNG